MKNSPVDPAGVLRTIRDIEMLYLTGNLRATEASRFKHNRV